MTKPTIMVNGEEHTISLVLNPMKLLMISRDFKEANSIATLQISGSGMELDLIKLYKLVYLAYRLDHVEEYMSFEEFSDGYDFDMQEAVSIYSGLISKEYRTEYLKAINKATPKGKGKNKGVK